jgi:hypothetical protein
MKLLMSAAVVEAFTVFVAPFAPGSVIDEGIVPAGIVIPNCVKAGSALRTFT